MITLIRALAALLALVLVVAAWRGRGLDLPVTVVAYTVAAMILTAVWGLGRIYRKPTHGGH